MKYKVEVGYYDFLFDDLEQATIFAQMAFNSLVCERDEHKSEKVSITFIDNNKITKKED